MGSVLSPFNAFLLLQGIETVALRVERHVENARKVAEFLRDDPRVAWVNYAGFTDSPYYVLVQKYLNGQASSLFTFGIKGGHEAGKDFYDALKLITRLVNIGDAKSLACHPASTTHRQMSPEQQRLAGILPETIRLSIGIEHSDDIIEDIDQALAAGPSRRLEAAEYPAGHAMTVPFDKHLRVVSPALAPTQPREADRFKPGQAGDAVLTIGLINNMPDPALQATERQFTRLLQAAAGNRRIHLHCFSLPSVKRSPQARALMTGRYTDIADLGRRPPAGVIVTGAAPIA